MSPATVRENLRELSKSVSALNGWSYEGTVRQEFYQGDQPLWTMAARIIYARQSHRAAAVQIAWHDGVVGLMPSSEQIRTGVGLPDRPYLFMHMFADADHLVVYQAQMIAATSAPGSEPQIDRSVALHKGNASLIAEYNLDLPQLSSRALLGYAPGTTKRLTDLLLEATDIQLRPARERIDGALCVVAEFASEQGNVKLWLDPAIGYQIRRADIERGPTDKYSDRVLWEAYKDRDARRTESCRWFNFVRVQNVHVPTAYEATATTTMSMKPAIRERETGRIAVAHASRPSGYEVWSTHDIPPGTPGLVFSEAGRHTDQLQYAWKEDELLRVIDSDRGEGIAKVVASVTPRSHRALHYFEVAMYLGACAIAITILFLARRRMKAVNRR